METLEYKSFIGTCEYSAEDRAFHGKLLDIEALVSYEAETQQGLEVAFKEAVDNYIRISMPTLDPTEP